VSKKEAIISRIIFVQQQQGHRAKFMKKTHTLTSITDGSSCVFNLDPLKVLNSITQSNVSQNSQHEDPKKVSQNSKKIKTQNSQIVAQNSQDPKL